MVEELPAGVEEFFPGLHSADGVFKFRNMSLRDVDEVFFHLLDVLGLDEAGDLAGGFLVEQFDVFLHHLSGNNRDCFAEKGGAELWKNPRVADGSASDHEPGCVGLLEIGEAGGEVDDIAIGNDRAGELFDGLADFFRMNGRLVTLYHRAPVNGQQVNRVFFKNGKEGLEFIRRFVSDSGFHGEGKITAGFAQCAEKLVDFFEIPEKSSAGFLAADHRCGTAEIEVDAGDGMFFEFVNGTDQFAGVLSDHLGDDRSTGGILGD